MTKILSLNLVDYLNGLLAQDRGVAIGDDHMEIQDKLWLAEHLHEINADVVFLEQDRYQQIDNQRPMQSSQQPKIDAQAIIDNYLSHPDDSDARANARKCVVNYHHEDEGDSYFQIIEAAARTGKRVVLINIAGDIKERNDFMEINIRDNTGNDKKYLILVGHGHIGERGIGDVDRSLSKRLGIKSIVCTREWDPQVANNPEIPLPQFCVFKGAGGSNFDAAFNLYAYTPRPKKEMPLSPMVVEKPIEHAHPKSMLEVRAGEYDEAANAIAKIASILQKKEGAAPHVEQLQKIKERLAEAKQNDPLVPKSPSRGG